MTLTEAQAGLAAYTAALTAVAGGAQHTIGDRQWRSHDLKELRDTVDWYQRKVNALTEAASGLPAGSRGYALADFSDC
jgi:hypothetical protein